MTLSGQSALSSASGSLPWNEADNAAGFVLRYMIPMREQLIQWTGNEAIADEALRRLIAHLVTQGFGANGKGRIRDFLLRGIRSAAKSAIGEVTETNRPSVDFSQWTSDAPAWIATWRKGLLTRAWRSLERLEHAEPAKCYYTALRAATEHPEENAAMLTVRINSQVKQKIDPQSIREVLESARTAFAQLLEHEIIESLDRAGSSAVTQEIEFLGLTGIFASSRAN
jgi:hypothetical protein